MPATASPAADFLTLSEAARIAGRSYSWARSRALLDRRLDVRRFSPGGVIHVTAASLYRLLEMERQPAVEPGPAPRRRRRQAHLRLVIDNT